MQLHNGKAAGPDGTVAEHLRLAEPVLMKHLAFIYNCIINVVKYLKQFKRGLVISLFKSGKRDWFDANNYYTYICIANTTRKNNIQSTCSPIQQYKISA